VNYFSFKCLTFMHYMLSFPSLSEVLLVLIYFMVHYSVVDEKTCHLDGDGIVADMI
jgi:hypothetical protein